MLLFIILQLIISVSKGVKWTTTRRANIFGPGTNLKPTSKSRQAVVNLFKKFLPVSVPIRWIKIILKSMTTQISDDTRVIEVRYVDM